MGVLHWLPSWAGPGRSRAFSPTSLRTPTYLPNSPALDLVALDFPSAPISKQWQQCRIQPPHLQIPTRPGYAPNATHPVTPHTPLEGFVSPLLEEMDATGPSSTYKFKNAQNLTGSTRNMSTGHGLLVGDAQTLDPRHEGGTGHNSRLPPETDAVVPECEPASCVKGRRPTFPSRRGEGRP